MTFQVAIIAVIGSTVLGTLLGLALARGRSRGIGAAETLLLLPMVTPEIILGLSLLLLVAQVFGQSGSVGQLSLSFDDYVVSAFNSGVGCRRCRCTSTPGSGSA